MIALTEYTTCIRELSAADIGDLASFTRGSIGDGSAGPRVIQSLIPTSAPGSYTIQPGPFIGRFALRSGTVVEISSQFDFADLLRVLSIAAQRPSLLQEARTPAAEGKDLLDIIAMAFCREMRRVVGFGLAKGYEVRTFERPPYPGVPDAHRHLVRYLGRPDRLVTRARRQTMDTPANRVLAAARRLLASVIPASTEIGTQLRALRPVFAAVTDIHNARQVLPAAKAHAPARYVEALALAELVLGGLTALPSGTAVSGPSILFDMTKVWEGYVRATLEPTLAEGHSLKAQYGIQLTTSGPRIGVKADFVDVDDSGTPTAVYDAKYKAWGEKPDSGEIYQVVTYAYRLGLSEATLVYPGRGEMSEVRVDDYVVRTRGLRVLRDDALVLAVGDNQ